MSQKISTLDIIKKVAHKSGTMQKDIKLIMNALVDVLTDELSGGNYICIKHLLSMQPKKSKKTQYHNPKTGVSITIPSKFRVQTKCSKTLITKINEKLK